MKRKIGKLSLKKQTVSNLSHVDLNSVKGGDLDSGSGCTICTYCYDNSIRICWDDFSHDTECNTTP